MRGRRHAQRVTNAHRAAVCGLIIAGITYMKACKIVGVPHRALRTVVEPDWYKRSNPVRRWHLEALLGLQEAWMDPKQKLSTIAARYDISVSMVRMLAHRQGWPCVRRGRQPRSLRSMTKEQRRWYLKMQPVIGRNAALAEVWR